MTTHQHPTRDQVIDVYARHVVARKTGVHASDVPDHAEITRWGRDAADRRLLPSGRPPGTGDGILVRVDRDRCRIVARTYCRDLTQPDTALVVQDITRAHPHAVHRYVRDAAALYTDPDGLSPVIHVRYADLLAVRT
jgi:hypothetical protein